MRYSMYSRGVPTCTSGQLWKTLDIYLEINFNVRIQRIPELSKDKRILRIPEMSTTYDARIQRIPELSRRACDNPIRIKRILELS